MAKVEVRASPVWRTVEIVGGIIVIMLAGISLADPQFVVTTFVIVIGLGLVIGGIFRIGVGLSALILPSPLRTLNTAGGVIAVVLGAAVLLDLNGAQTTLINLLALALLLVGALEIGVGVSRHPPAWLRFVIVTIGLLTIILSGFVIINPSVGQTIIAAVLSFALLLIGLRNIIHGVTGHHSVPSPIDNSVTAA